MGADESPSTLKVDIAFLAIIDGVLFIFLAALIITAFAPYQCECTRIIVGNLECLENGSEPSNPSVGVWLKLELERPSSVKLNGEANLLIYKGNQSIDVSIEKMHSEKDGVVVDIVDANHDGLIDSGDKLHIYGMALDRYTIALYILGFSGTISARIP